MPIRAYIFGRFTEESYHKVMKLTSEYEELSAKELVDIYNKGYETGFFGAYSQGLHFAAVHNAFIEKFGLSPFHAVGLYIAFTKEIVLTEEGNWSFMEPKIENYEKRRGEECE
jgi:hypothetical protein